MKSIINTIVLILLLIGLARLADALWYQYWYRFGQLAMRRYD